MKRHPILKKFDKYSFALLAFVSFVLWGAVVSGYSETLIKNGITSLSVEMVLKGLSLYVAILIIISVLALLMESLLFMLKKTE